MPPFSKGVPPLCEARHGLKAPCNPTLGPILISLSRSVVSDQYLTFSGSANVSFGSKPDERGHRPGGPLLEVKQKKSAAKRTLPLEGRLSGAEML